MPITINGTGPIDGITSLNTSVSSTELGYLDGTTSAIQTQINTAGGLVKIVDQSLNAASGISINNCFTSTYQNYRIIISASGSQNSNNGVYLRLRSSGSDATTNYACVCVFLNATYFRDTQTTIFQLGALGAWTAIISVDVASPALTERTSISGVCGGGVSDFRNAVFGGTHESSTAFDGFTLYSQTGTNNLFTGNIRVYGYRN